MPLFSDLLHSSHHTYSTDNLLGEGKRGKVVRATDEMGQLYALKAMHTRSEQKKRRTSNAYLRNMFAPDGSSLAAKKAYEIGLQLDHPNIIKTYELLFQDGVSWIVLEYVDGTPLNRISPGSLQKDVAFKLGMQFLDALEYAGHHEYFHRDIFSENFMVDIHLELKMIDLDSFGHISQEGTNHIISHQHYLNKINRTLMRIMHLGDFKEEELNLFSKKINVLSMQKRFRFPPTHNVSKASYSYLLDYLAALKYIIQHDDDYRDRLYRGDSFWQ